jgi:hypothetical protein
MKFFLAILSLLGSQAAFGSVPALNISLSKSPLLQGQPYAIFISDPNYQSHPTLNISAQLDGISVSLIHAEPDLWAFPGASLNMVRSHMLVLALSEQGLLVGSTTFSFEVAHNDSDAAFPKFTSAVPNITGARGGTTILIKGANFVSGAKVQATTSFVDSSNLLAVTPVFTDVFGIQPVEVQLPTTSVLGDYPNVIATNAFYISDSEIGPNPSPSPNQIPVSIILNASQSVTLGSGVQLDGSQSYDPQGNPISYEWTYSAAPLASSFQIGGTVGIGSDVSFTPDAPGVYVISLVVRQAGVATPSASHAQLAVIQVTNLSRAQFNAWGFSSGEDRLWRRR